MSVKPGIIVLSANTDDEFNWASDGWFCAEVRHTKRAQSLMRKVKRIVTKAANVPEACKALEAAGFEIRRPS